MDPIEGILHGRIVPILERDRSIPPNLAKVLDKALSSNAKERFANGKEMLTGMRKALA